MADVTGDFDLTLTGDSASAVGLNAVDVDALAVTGTLTLNNNITVDDSVDLSTNVASITLAANSVIDVEEEESTRRSPWPMLPETLILL